jgi:hypothetical protein
VQKKQLPFAAVYAMTLTARDVKTEEQAVMRRVFDRPTPYAMNALMVRHATKQTMVASVEYKDGFGGTPAKRFLNPHVNGGARSLKSHELQIAPLLRTSSYLVPARGMPVNAHGNVTGGTFRKIISQLKVSPDPITNASGSARSRRKRKAVSYFVSATKDIVFERRGKDVKPALIGVRAPVYSKRFPFYETAARVVAQRMPVNFEIAFQRTMATSNYKGKWG